MRLNNYLNSRINLVGAFCLLIGLTSCGSYQYAGYQDDGIYGTPERTIEVVEVTPTQETPNTNSDYYQNYFREKALELDNMNTDELIFTDIDEYESSTIENDSLDYQGFGGWGQNSSDVTVTIYNRPFINSYYPWSWRNRFLYPYNGWYNGWAHWNYGYGFYDPWYSPFYLGWNSPFWFNNYPFYGYGYSNFYYGNNFYNRRGLAFNASRRGGIYSRSNLNGITNRRNFAGRSSNSTISRRNTAVSTNRVRSTSDAVQGRRAIGTRDGVRPRTSTTRPRTTTSRPRTSTSRPSSTVTRPRTTTRSSGLSSMPMRYAVSHSLTSCAEMCAGSDACPSVFSTPAKTSDLLRAVAETKLPITRC